jgi:hypothetical protein
MTMHAACCRCDAAEMIEILVVLRQIACVHAYLFRSCGTLIVRRHLMCGVRSCLYSSDSTVPTVLLNSFRYVSTCCPSVAQGQGLWRSPCNASMLASFMAAMTTTTGRSGLDLASPQGPIMLRNRSLRCVCTSYYLRFSLSFDSFSPSSSLLLVTRRTAPPLLYRSLPLPLPTSDSLTSLTHPPLSSIGDWNHLPSL